jgi:hypothetical protein
MRLMLLAAVLLAAASGQAPDRATAAGLELHFQPDAIEQGMPRAFIFLLVNKTGREMRVPVPSFGCENGSDGSVSLSRNFTPKGPPKPSQGFGCAGDGPFVPITERIGKWQVLFSGEALALRVDPEKIVWKIMLASDSFALSAGREHIAKPGMRPYLYDNTQAGDYKFWATYSPPYISLSDQGVLNGLGVDFPPQRKLASDRADFVRE